ncbi:hypothetical protein KSP39_PZI023580 [Platanthera zijinensis]|uniref:Uncharacterized protein n=1 Tax=Platanthera zijinensis TaxID=2320716 RepID=A0AAP0FT90_9ASPA
MPSLYIFGESSYLSLRNWICSPMTLELDQYATWRNLPLYIPLPRPPHDLPEFPAVETEVVLFLERVSDAKRISQMVFHAFKSHHFEASYKAIAAALVAYCLTGRGLRARDLGYPMISK